MNENISKEDYALPVIQIAGVNRALSFRPDTIDFRDLMYVPSLIEVPPIRKVEDYMKHEVPVLDQGQEGACTGFGLATVANYLLRARTIMPDTSGVSPRMLYEMARRYDEWPGEDYDGSSARGAMKGWHKHGVCAESLWPYDASVKDSVLTSQRALDALQRPLGAYFRVNHKDLVSMHAAITEVGVLYAAAMVHEGWSAVGSDGVIPTSKRVLGGHAFAIVGYDSTGFWIQNSWGEGWGWNGFGRISYGDWLENGVDVWVARLGVPIIHNAANEMTLPASAILSISRFNQWADLRNHVISIGNEGRLYKRGEFATREEDIERIIENFEKVSRGWSERRLLVYAHGGLVSQRDTVEKLLRFQSLLLANQIYPVFISWRTDVVSTIVNIIRDAFGMIRPEGSLDDFRGFLFDRLDQSIEIIARLPGKAMWDEMKENALKASSSKNGGMRFLVSKLLRICTKDSVDIHIASHSAGAIILGPFVNMLVARRSADSSFSIRAGELPLSVKTCTLLAPACTIDFFRHNYLSLLKRGSIEDISIYTMSDEAERRDDCLKIYNKSLLYLVSNSFEERFRQFGPAVCGDSVGYGEPILGMERYIECDSEISNLIRENPSFHHVVAGQSIDDGGHLLSQTEHHGDFDNDLATLRSLVARILGIFAGD